MVAAVADADVEHLLQLLHLAVAEQLLHLLQRAVAVAILEISKLILH